MKLTPTTKKSGACLICADITGKCRTSEGSLILCMSEHQSINGWNFIGTSRDGLWGKFLPSDTERESQSDRENRLRARQESEARTRDAMPPTQRNVFYHRMLSELSLDAVDRDDLIKRGFTLDEIASAGYKSVGKWQKLGTAYPVGLPGLGIGGNSLITTGDGYLIPVRDVHGRIVAFQQRLRNGENGRYRWLSSATKKNPNGATPHNQHGELPLSVVFPAENRHPATVAILEGTASKPFLAANRLGMVAIGAAGGQWASSPQTLRETLEALGNPKRVILYPDGGATQNPNVMRQYRALHDLLKSWGVKLSVAWWGQTDKTDGDIDEISDYSKIAIIGWKRFEGFSTATGKRAETVARAKAILKNTLPAADVMSHGRYLPALAIEPDHVLAVDSAMGTGKTTRIVELVNQARDQGLFTVWLSPRNSLGQQSAKLAGLPHVHDYGCDRDSSQALGADMRVSGGVVLCPNSLARAKVHFPTDRPIQLVIDEAMATLGEACEGGTLKGKWGNTLEVLISLLRSAESVIIAESNIDRATCDLVSALSGKPVTVHRHQGIVNPWRVRLIAGGSPHRMRAEIRARLKAGEKIWLTSTGLDELRLWELWAQDNGVSHAVICGETNDKGRFDGFFSDPDTWLSENKPQLLLTNQSVQTGLSVTLPWFDAVYAYAPGFPAEVIYQQLGRYRVPCDRVVWVPNFITPLRFEKPQREAILGELDHEAKRWGGKGFSAHKSPEQQAIDDFLAARWESRWAQKIAPGDALQSMLASAGHQVTIEDGLTDEASKELWAELRDRLARNRAEQMATITLEGHHTEKWARAMLNEGESTYEQRCTARKVLMGERFPGIDWDDTEIWYQAVYVPRSGDEDIQPLAPGASLWAESAELGKVWGLDQARAIELLGHRLKPIHMLPDGHTRAELMAPFRPLAEELLKGGMVKHGDPWVAQIAKLARLSAGEIFRYLRITATDDQSDIAIACKILRKFGLSLQRHQCNRVSGRKVWSYRVIAPDLWRQLVEARTKALQALRALAPSATDLLEESINKSVAPIPTGLSQVDWDDLRSMVRTAVEGGKAAIAELREVIIGAFSPHIWQALNA